MGGLPTHAHFLFSYSSIRLSKFFSPGRKRVERWRMVRGITLVEPPPPGRKHQKLGREILPRQNVPIFITFYYFFKIKIYRADNG